MARKRISASELARHTGLPPSTIKRLRNNAHNNPTLGSLIPIANYFSVTLSQLVGENLIQESDVHIRNFPSCHTLPIYTWEQLPNLNKIEHSVSLKKIAVGCEISHQGFAVELTGNEGENITQGALLIVDPLLNPKAGSLVVVQKNQEMAAVKKYFMNDGTIYLKPLFSGMAVFPLTNDYLILGTAMQILTNLY